jgi:hypothetical protein
MASSKAFNFPLGPDSSVESDSFPLDAAVLHLLVDIVVYAVLYHQRTWLELGLVGKQLDFFGFKMGLQLLAEKGRVSLGKVESASLEGDHQDTFEEGVVEDFARTEVEQPGYFGEVIEDDRLTLLLPDSIANPVHLLLHALAGPFLMQEDPRLGCAGPIAPDFIHRIALQGNEVESLVCKGFDPFEGAFYLAKGVLAVKRVGSKPTLVWAGYSLVT